MSGPYQPATRRAPRAGVSQPLPAVSAGDRLFEEWRADVNARQDDLLDKAQRTALILERLNGRLDEHDRRISALEQAPDTRERKTIAVGGLATNLAYLGLLLISLVISLSAHISFH